MIVYNLRFVYFSSWLRMKVILNIIEEVRISVALQ